MFKNLYDTGCFTESSRFSAVGEPFAPKSLSCKKKSYDDDDDDFDDNYDDYSDEKFDDDFDKDFDDDDAVYLIQQLHNRIKSFTNIFD